VRKTDSFRSLPFPSKQPRLATRSPTSSAPGMGCSPSLPSSSRLPSALSTHARLDPDSVLIFFDFLSLLFLFLLPYDSFSSTVRLLIPLYVSTVTTIPPSVVVFTEKHELRWATGIGCFSASTTKGLFLLLAGSLGASQRVVRRLGNVYSVAVLRRRRCSSPLPFFFSSLSLSPRQLLSLVDSTSLFAAPFVSPSPHQSRPLLSH
jgi:hypothetical protein